MKYIFSILIVFLALPVFAQQQTQAKLVLDKTAAAFERGGGINASFSLKAYSKGRFQGESSGIIQLKGAKFMLKTPEVITWFDGQTQWSYLTGSDEVNVSTPTPDELQSINPYSLLYLYQKGFAYTLGSTTVFGGKPVYEVILKATGRKHSLARVVLYVARDTYQPVGIIAESANKEKSEITVTSFQSGRRYADSAFVFNKKQYPTAEVIDLR